ncbi:hypothetical protein [Sandaracinus amylolyticus]|uniref:hypothetical protein n=1 Tax=Sandaracinus amylolyticus TaxID=927083 RepID=UPI001F26B309|nr:hypothetical protein [Sandaracinus amylolyticus]UJR83630.1 Hypothetical protein I5071_56980 [Sandaracinus amylolyticus]
MERTRIWVIVTTAITLGIAAPVSAQIEQGDVVYIEGADGGLELYRRLDRPNEPDGRAQFVRLGASEAEAFVGGGGINVVPVVDRDAVVMPAATTEVAVQPPPGGEVVVGSETAVAQPIEVGAAAEPERPFGRFRFGISGFGGMTLGDDANDPEGWMGGGALRLGMQLGDWFSVYYQPSGIATGLDTTGGDSELVFTLWNSLLAEATLFDFLSIGAGPSVDFYFGCEASEQSQASCADEGAFFGLHGRVAINIGGLLFGQRGAVNVSFDVHPTWFEDDTETVALLGGLGLELY